MYVASDLTTTAVAVKASAGKVHGVFMQSTGALAYLSLWNVAQGSVTVGTTSQDFALGVSATSGQTSVAYSWARPTASHPVGDGDHGGDLHHRARRGRAGQPPLVIIAYE
jgi:hypothetical protein